jgi:hypothetical protein
LSIESELQRLALLREDAFESALDELDLDPPEILLRQMRAYLADQEDLARVKHFAEKSVQLEFLPTSRKQPDIIQELKCLAVNFTSGSSLDFNIRLKREQSGWRLIQFKFHLHLPPARKVDMVRVHLNVTRPRDALIVPRCHLHIGGGKRAHVPFPIMSPRLILQLICDVIEPDLGG